MTLAHASTHVYTQARGPRALAWRAPRERERESLPFSEFTGTLALPRRFPRYAGSALLPLSPLLAFAAPLFLCCTRALFSISPAARLVLCCVFFWRSLLIRCARARWSMNSLSFSLSLSFVLLLLLLGGRGRRRREDSRLLPNGPERRPRKERGGWHVVFRKCGCGRLFQKVSASLLIKHCAHYIYTIDMIERLTEIDFD